MIPQDQERLSEEARRMVESETFQLVIERLKSRFRVQLESIYPHDPLVVMLLTKMRLLNEIVEDLRAEAASWKVSAHNLRAQDNAELRVSKN